MYSNVMQDKFEKRKLELSSTLVSVENRGDNQRSRELPSDLVSDLQTKHWLHLLNFRLTQKMSLLLRSQIHTLNKLLQKQEQEKLEMNQELS